MDRMEGVCECYRSANQISISATGKVRASVQKLNGDMAFLSFYHHEHLFAEALSLTCINLKAIIQMCLTFTKI